MLPELQDVMREKPWDKQHTLPWDHIKQVWDKHWNAEKPLWLEKSPPNIIRTNDIQQHFKPAQFIIMVRNPYAQAEGLMRRNNWPAQKAANFALMCLRTQLENAKLLKNSLVLTYESLVSDPAGSCGNLAQFIPALSDLDDKASFEVHSIDGTLTRPITDLNMKKIESLPPKTRDTFTQAFTEHAALLHAWHYDLIV